MAKTPREKIILPEKYYHTYFIDLISFVKKHSAHLIDDRAKRFLGQYLSLSEDAQCLFLRFSNRRGPYFRMEKIDYAEIDIEKAQNELLEVEFISEDISYHPRLLKLYTKQELWDLLGEEFSLDKKMNKDVMLEVPYLPLIKKESQPIEVLKQDELEYVKMLYFGHYRGRMTDFVVRDVGHVSLESLDETKFKPWFAEVEEARALFDISRISYLIRRAMHSVDVMVIIPNLKHIDFGKFMTFPKSKKTAEKLLFELARELERVSEPQLALSFYQQIRSAPSRERQIRILDNLGKTPDAISLAEEILNDFQNAAELMFAKDFLSRPNIRINRSTTARVAEAEIIEIKPDASIKVEELAINYFLEKGFNGIHGENFLWRNLYGLFFWEELFDQNLDNFHNPLQRSPSDLRDQSFYENRKDIIQDKLSSHADKNVFFEKLEATFHSKKGISNPFVYWFGEYLQIAEVMVDKIPVDAILKVLHEMSRNLSDNTKGFPDLFIWNEDHYKFYEVKSPNDQLSPQQHFWIDFMIEAGIEVDILRLKYI